MKETTTDHFTLSLDEWMTLSNALFWHTRRAAPTGGEQDRADRLFNLVDGAMSQQRIGSITIRLNPEMVAE